MGCRCARRERAPLPRRVMRRLRSYRPRSMRAGDCPNFRGHRREALVDENGTVPLAAAACDAHLLEMHIHLTTLAEGVGRFKGSFCATRVIRLLPTRGEIGKAGPRRQAHFCRLSGVEWPGSPRLLSVGVSGLRATRSAAGENLPSDGRVGPPSQQSHLRPIFTSSRDLD